MPDYDQKTVAACRDIVLARYDSARRERHAHLSRGGSHGGVEAMAASLKMAWARNVLLDVDALSPPPPGARPVPD